MELKFRPLKANEVECRVAQIKEDGVILLLYKDARCDMRILDETVTPFGWQREHKELKGNIYCGVSIKDTDTGEWVTKWDCGKESYTESEKGEASDSFKRACFNFGIGRELYTAPYIKIKPNDLKKFGKNQYGKLVCSDYFEVKHIKVENGEIVELIIFNSTTKQDCFVYGIKSTQQNNNADRVINQVELNSLLAYLKENGIAQKEIGARFNVKSLKNLTLLQYETIMSE